MRSAAAPVAVLALALLGCAEEEYPVSLWLAQHAGPDAAAPRAPEAGLPATPDADVTPGTDAGVPPPQAFRGVCHRVAAQPLPARLVSMSAAASTGNDLYYVSDLFERFKSVCGACHGPAVDPPGQGGYQIRSEHDFSTAMTRDVLRRIKSEGPSDPANPMTDPTDPMPPFGSPNGNPWSKRSSADPVAQFADLVQIWLDDGGHQSFSKPRGNASDQGGGADAGAPASPYLMSPLVGDTMTNLGSCVADKGMFAVQQASMATLDAKFAALTKADVASGAAAPALIGLPELLTDTDLVSLDTATLAQYGVVAFQPNYPLWSDDAGKLRYVRVPRGQSIQFDKTTQEFTIPTNTRFYKTFLKKIIDTDGSYRFRKIETRLIVSRPDQVNADGSSTPQALFGTYQWNANETAATLVETPLRSGLPFADTLLQYTTDEQLGALILASNPPLPLEALIEHGAARHYAIPSSERCIQCHMGSNSASFILGFRPVQLLRRAPGEGGTRAEPGQLPPQPDELTQLQRLIDYGVISGMASPDDVLPLERSEGNRAPRTPQELAAQGYMVGNCAHCHNPRGFPSVSNPLLVDVLNFLPGPNGGIFQFPLERYSPRIGRGPGGGEPIPYITPSLMDQPSANAPGENYLFGLAGSGAVSDVGYILYAPWRSLIYRNVDTPFPYETDLALFPHMPMNTPGFDCRAKQIMSDWMVSIPSIRKDPEIPEYAFQTNQGLVGGSTVDVNAQPYVEVLPGTPGYENARRAAEARLAILHSGNNPAIAAESTYSVYDHCPDTSDLVDPAVTLDPVCHQVPVPDVSSVLSNITPAHPHWVNTDLTQAPSKKGEFDVRRTDWPQNLVSGKFPDPQQSCTLSVDQVAAAQNEVKKVVRLLQDVHLDDPNQPFRSFATTQVPFGLWKKKPGCNFSSVPTADSFTGAKRPHWMGQVPNLAPSDPVYMLSPGAAVFGMICVNCHGPNADAHGRLADNLATMTGGNAIVANFKDGLFGPLASPGLHRAEAFATSLLPAGAGKNWTDATVDDRAARYMAFMALGGTEVHIPTSILTVVGDTKVLGVERVLDSVSANMLSAAKSICAGFLRSPSGLAIDFNWTRGWFELDKPGHLKNFPLVIPTNGDAELWLRMCSINNPPPVRALFQPQFATDPNPPYSLTDGRNQAVDGRLFDPGVYGQNPVGDQDGTQGVLAQANDAGVQSQRENYFPWCASLDETAGSPIRRAAAETFLLANHVPICPMQTGNACPTSPPDGGGPAPCWGADRQDEWATRGAINAGLAVYLYVDSLVKNLAAGKSPAPSYDQCDKLP